MVLLGAFLNALFIIMGAFVGRIFKNIPETMKQTVLSIIGLAVAVLGIQMGFESSNFIIVIVVMTVVSGMDYLMKNLNYFKDAE